MSHSRASDLKSIGPPKLKNFSCQVIGSNNGPAVCRLELELEDQEAKDKVPTQLDLQPQTLNTLLDGLTKIRDQLSTVAHQK